MRARYRSICGFEFLSAWLPCLNAIHCHPSVSAPAISTPIPAPAISTPVSARAVSIRNGYLNTGSPTISTSSLLDTPSPRPKTIFRFHVSWGSISAFCGAYLSFVLFFCYFCSPYHVDSSTVHVHASAQCIHIFPGLHAFSGLGLGLLPGEFGFIQPFRGIPTHSGLSVCFLESFAALCTREHASDVSVWVSSLSG